MSTERKITIEIKRSDLNIRNPRITMLMGNPQYTRKRDPSPNKKAYHRKRDRKVSAE